MKESVKGFIGAIIGGFIGTVVAFQLGFFWWLGTIFGFVIGYLVYDFGKVIQAIKNASKAVIHWRPNKPFWKIFVTVWFGHSNCTFTMVIGFFSLMFLTKRSTQEVNLHLSDILYVVVFMITVSLVVGLFVAIKEFFECKDELGRQTLVEDAKKISKSCNPVCFYLYLLPKYAIIGVLMLIKFVFFLITHTPKFIGKIATGIYGFIKRVFIEIHSDARLLCGVDSFLGVVVGCICGNAIIGGLAGGVFWIFDLQIISKKFLRLALAKK